MYPLTTLKFITKRLADDWKLLLTIFFGIVVASSLVAGAPVYLNSLQRLAVNTAIDRTSQVTLDILVFAPNIPVRGESVARSDDELEASLDTHIASLYTGREKYLKGPTLLVGTPDRPLAAQVSDRVSRGYFQSLSNLEQHVTLLEGRMAGDEVTQGGSGPAVEIVVGEQATDLFDLQVDDIVVLAPSLGDPVRVTARVTGIIEPIDSTEQYWHGNANLFLRPAPLAEVPDAEVEIDAEEPPLAMFLTKDAMMETLRAAYPGTLLSSTWFVFVDKEALKRPKPEDLQERMTALSREFARKMPGSAVLTRITSLISNFERRSFFSSVPLLLLLTIMVMTVVYYIAMMVSYLVRNRENDVALLRSRGVSTAQLFRLYAVEGLALTVVAVIIAPFLAMGAVALAGTLPYFQDITSGAMLPVELTWPPFLFAAGVGLLSMAVFIVPGVIGARTGLVMHRLRSSRPPSVPIFQRYYLDLLLIALGGIVFWELQARGQLVSGGLFSDVQVNEALLFAPVLLLTVVALLFMRVFPLFIRFFSGESSTLVDLLAAFAAPALALALAVQGLRADETAWILPAALSLAVGATYWLTSRTEAPSPRYRRAGLALAVIAAWWAALWVSRRTQNRGWYAGLALQAWLVVAVLWIEPPVPGTLSFIPSLGLIAIVPAQLVFMLLSAWSREAPVWVSMGLWHMARNPLQYSWLVLLLVMVTGLGVLSTTVGSTLDRSHEERILYEVVADLRVVGAPGNLSRGRSALQERYLGIDGVTAVSLALRGRGTVGSAASSRPFEVLALESEDFQYISWYREDFSQRSLPAIMRALQPPSKTEPVNIPEGTTELGVWAKPRDVYSNMFLWMVIQDSRGVLDTVTLGEMGEPEWHLMRAEMPRGLKPPLELVSLQIFEPVFGPSGTPGAVWIDDIHAVVGPDGEEVVLDDFERGTADWTALATSILSTDALTPTTQDALRDETSGLFAFGKDTDNGIRGLYRSPSGGPVPIVVSSTFLGSTGTNVGDTFIMSLFGRLIPVTIRDAVHYFPTMDPAGTGFVLTDLDSTLRHLNLLSPTGAISPNELFIREAPGADLAVRQAVVGLVGSTQLVHDRESELASVRLDPLVTAGWKAMVLLSTAIIVLTAGLGYVTYLMAFADRSRSEMGFLQSLGLSRRQMTGLLNLEHLVIVAIGLGLGSVTGWLMSDIMVSAVAVTEEGKPVIPPFILQVDLWMLGPIYVALIGIFLASIYRLTRSMHKVDLHAISRMEGE